MSPETERKFYEKIYRLNYVKQTAEKQWEVSLPEAHVRVSRFLNLFTPESRVLEIGCASGSFLSEAKDHVKSVTGIELTKEFVEYAKRHGMEIKTSLDEIPDHSFDLIFMFHVLEHIDDPVAFLKSVGKKLARGGKLIVEVPNVDDILVSVYKIKNHLDFYWEVAHHYYFSYKSLSTVLERAGYSFEIVPLQRYDLSNHINWMLTGKPGGQGRFNTIFTPTLVENYVECLKDKFLCDTIYAVAELK
jgi:2-polyprenyl-3-methyl-5-hydroxy-6-metoxy-1,4-benzoquinol methylase